MTTSTLIGYKALSDLVGRFSVFATVILAARLLTTHEFGILAVATTTGWLLGVLCDFGVQLHVAREIAQRPDAALPLVQPILRWRLGSIALASLAVAPIALVYLSLVDAAVFLALVLAQLAGSVIELLNHVYRGLSRSDLESSINLGHRVAALAATAVLLPSYPHLGTLAAVLLLSASLALVISTGAWHRFAPRGRPAFSSTSTSTNRVPGSVLSVPGTVLREAWPIGAGIVFSALYFRIDLLLVGYWRGAEGAALYSAVFRLVDALRLFPAAVLAVIFPALCRARDWGPLTRLTLSLGATAVVVSSGVYLFAPRLVRLFYGDAYLDAVPAFRILLLAAPLLFVNYALTHQLIGWASERRYALLCLGALAVNLSINLVMIPRYGFEGAAWTTLATEVFLTAGCLWALRAASAERTSSALLPAAS
jgi:O-antigen/teichoic acid export membrane protein